ncbi:hypothetical protein DC522_33255 [Microvirga sp. KLBC 81]|nr:hypothetical protein DC522_33255 [Microvirga sp. KLBC 81]
MPSRDDEPNLDIDNELRTGRRISFRDYPSTGLVVLAALVSGLGWLVYRWSEGKRAGQSTASNKLQEAQADGVVPKTPVPEDKNASAEPRADIT